MVKRNTEHADEGNASTRSQLHANETIPVCIWMKTGTSQTFKTWSQTHIQIRSNHNSGGVMTTAKIDDNILHLFQHRPQVILGDITVTKKMDRTPDVCQTKRHKCTFSMRVFTCRIQRCGNQQCPNQCLCKVRSQSTRHASPGQLRTSCSCITAGPMHCSMENFTFPASADPRC